MCARPPQEDIRDRADARQRVASRARQRRFAAFAFFRGAFVRTAFARGFAFDFFAAFPEARFESARPFDAFAVPAAGGVRALSGIGSVAPWSIASHAACTRAAHASLSGWA